MKRILKYLLAGTLLTIVAFLLLGYISSFIGWYGYKKWQYRVGSQSVQESKKRNVFVKELNFKIDSFSGSLGNFQPFIEKGFKYGYHSSEDTRNLENTQYLYQLSFNYRPTDSIAVSIRKDQLEKFDSADYCWGFLKKPYLSDTIILEIRGENVKSGIIKVW